MCPEVFIEKVARFTENRNGVSVIGIDGRCSSGKTTISRILAEKLGAAVIPMDAFFIPAAMRGFVDYSVPGANSDRRRFLCEVVPQIQALRLGSLREIRYTPFDCHTQSMLAPVVRPVSRLVVVEGSYSLHPELREIYDLKVFCDISKEEQLRRLSNREGASGIEMFISRWIPLEELYFSATAAESSADIVLS